jgi:acid phosphatase
VGGEEWGIDNDDFDRIPANVSTVVDLLDTKGISWGEYQEGLPYAGFQGFNYSNQVTFAADYVRKHNPLILYDSVVSNATRLALIKNFTSFKSDLAAHTLPQWSFITPNMTNDGHDTNITFSGAWARGFLEPLLNNTYFMNNTLVVLSFDETATANITNKVFTVLLGGAIPSTLIGTTDNTFYNHYSMLSTVEANWGLPSLGRWDCGANILQTVANVTGYTNKVVDTTHLFFNSSYPGPLSDLLYTGPVWPVPDTNAICVTGFGVLPSIQKTWGTSTGTYNYTNDYPYDAKNSNNIGGTPLNVTQIANGTASSTASKTGTSTTSSPSVVKSSGAELYTRSFGLVAAVAGGAAVLFVL